MNDKHDLDDIDRFWDLESLLPQKRQVRPNRSVNTDTVELDLETDTDDRQKRFGGSSIPLRKVESEPVDRVQRAREVSMRIKARQNEPVPLEPYLVYSPENPIIEKVSISKWQTRFNFYSRFKNDAARLWDRTAQECRPVSFFSYIPQHNQLSYAQLNWYIYWRSQMRCGNYIETDYSYILLFIYEIINSPELIEPKDGVDMLCSIWTACRKSFPRIDNYLADWLCDYCLIHQLPCPTDKLQPFLQAAISAATFKEFYMKPDRIKDGAANILSFSTNYDWRTSKYVTKENINIFSEHINRAFSKVYSEILSNGNLSENPNKTTVRRDSYNGGLCTWDMKRCITIEYISYSRSPKFRFITTDIIKYSENRIRAALGIKAKLKVEALDDSMKRCIDEYFDEYLPIPSKKSKSRSSVQNVKKNEYENLYEPSHSAFSLENALEIEKNSWSTTEILTSALDVEDNAHIEVEDEKNTSNEEASKNISAAIPSENIDEVSGQNEFEELLESLDAPSLEALKLLAEGDISALSRVAAKYSTLADAIADKINESSFDIIGDSVIEPTEGGYRMICDYEEEIKSCLK